jgi:thiopeptide-type bacteriocin biosynthesis protein
VLASQGLDGLEPSGFFALRSPLLPFRDLREWSDGVCAPETGGDAARLELALAADRAMLTRRLLATWRRPAVREAVFLASPELDAALERATPGESGDKALRSLVAYFARMASRATPFGLFAGCSVGSLQRRTHLELGPRSGYGRHTRLDMDFLSALVSALETDPAVRQTLRYEPNSSLYRAGARLHYAEARLDASGRSYHLVALEETPELRATLEWARGGACLDELSAGLVDEQVSSAEAGEFVEELVASQVLVSNLGPPVTGDEAVHGLIDRLARHDETCAVAACLAQVRDGLERVDQAGVGGSSREEYAALRASLDPLPARAEPARLFQVDMLKTADGLSLGPAVTGELVRGLGILQRLADAGHGGTLQDFTERFVARYEGGEVPLVEALDEELGIGFRASAQAEPGGEPLLEGLDQPAQPPAADEWRIQDGLRLRLLQDAVRRGEHAIELAESDLDALAAPESPPPPPPDALAVFARLAASSAEAVDAGDFRLWLQGVSGPSGAPLLGRFCHADPALHRQVLEHLRAEEAHRPDAVFAEIVHLPEGRLGNILSRPVLRDYEIPFLGQSGAACDRQLPVTDLRVSVRGRRVVLRSERLDREVVPRLSTAHNFGLRSLGLYRFLCALQHQDSNAALGWSWGPLEQAPFLPRVTSGRLVLSRACWNLSAAELRPLVTAQGATRFAAVQELRQARGLPRYVALADFDNELVVDLDNVLSIESLLHLVKQRDAAQLVELFPPPDELCVHGPEGGYFSELVIPFVKAASPQVRREQTPPRATVLRDQRVAGASVSPERRAEEAAPRERTFARVGVQRRFSPGSEWLYARLYTGPAVADRLLVELIRPVVDAALESGAADSWFFIRYADPEPHLRLRLHGDPGRLAADVLPRLAASCAPFVEDGQISRWQLDTYVREVERYGGDEGIVLAERLFGVDSECALAILPHVPGDDGLAWRWKLALCGVDLLLDAFGFGLEEKRDWVRQQRDAFATEFRVDTRLKRQLGDKHRTERQGVDDLLRLARSADAEQYPALRALHRRTAALAPIVQELRSLDQAGRLSASLPALAASYAHMHVNRALRSAHRFQELALYELLDRAYRARLAQA